MDVLDTVFLGNTVGTWALALAAFLLTLTVLRLAKWALLGRVQKLAARTETDVDDLVTAVLDRTRAFFYVVVGVYVAGGMLALPPAAFNVVQAAVTFGVLAQAALWSSGAITFHVDRYQERQLAEDAGAVTTMAAVGFIGKLLVWTVVLLLALDNLGVDVTALVAGLGIGGVAVALALQNILGDLFAALSIVLDKPFVIGDFLNMGEHMGTVEHVGLKTTRLRSLSGEQLVFSNRDLLESRIRNFGRMRERRCTFRIGLTYDTPRPKVEAVPGMIREALERHDEVTVDRCHFKEFGDSALIYETVYYVSDPAYNTYMEIQQAVNLELLERFREEGLEFAFPTRTVHVDGADRREEANRRGETGHREGPAPTG